MMNVPQRITGITHPYVHSIYLKKDFGTKERKQDVLVIETIRAKAQADGDSFDSYLIDILTDLKDLKEQAEEQIGHFDRVDIRTH